MAQKIQRDIGFLGSLELLGTGTQVSSVFVFRSKVVWNTIVYRAMGKSSSLAIKHEKINNPVPKMFYVTLTMYDNQ